MANRTQIVLGTGQDLPFDMLLGSFQVGGAAKISNYGDGSGNYDTYVTELRIAEKVVLQAGMQPSYAIVEIPMAKFGPGNYDEKPYAVAFNQNGPAGKIRMNTRATIYARTGTGVAIPLLCGTVVKIGHGIKRDNALITVFDDRWLLNKITCFGKYIWDPGTGAFGFVEREPLIFNYLGYPDCLDSPKGPVFAPTLRYGWKVSPTNSSIEAAVGTFDAEPDPGAANTCARSWRVVDALERQRTIKGITTNEVVCGITSLDRRHASAFRLLTLARQHWHIENKLHYVRDVTLGEDACRVRSGAAPQVLAAVRNLVIGLLQRAGFTNKAAALRRHAAKPFEALGLLLGRKKEN